MRTILILGGLALVLWLLFSRGAFASGKIKQPGPGGKGDVFWTGKGPLNPADFPDFDFRGNGIFVSPDCSLVLEGEGFEPYSRGSTFFSTIPGAPTLAASLQLDNGTNTVYGFMQDLFHARTLQTPGELADEIVRQIAPHCIGEGGELPPAITAWRDDFRSRISTWVQEERDSIGLAELIEQ